MKLLLFIIIILVIYLLFINIKVVHSSTLPITEKKEVEDRQKIRQLLTTNHFKTLSPRTTPEHSVKIEKFSLLNDPSKTYMQKLPSANKLLSMIRSEFLLESYVFNFSNLPVTTRYPNSNSTRNDNKYIKYIKNSIEEWNDIFSKKYAPDKYLSIKDILLLFVKETESEFVIISIVKLLYQNKTLHLQTVYYGKICKNDDFINGGVNTWTLQLVDIKPVTKAEFNSSAKLSTKWTGPFMTMEEQMAYVNKINKMHQNEEEYLV